MQDNGNYYISAKIGDSGVANTQHPLFKSAKEYDVFKLETPRSNLGNLVEGNISEDDLTIGDVEQAIFEGKNIEDLRARRQSTAEMWGNALVNNLVIAGTTAVGGTAGLAWGLLEAAATGELNRIWNNSVNNSMVDIQNTTRENFAIHRGSEYEGKSIWEKLGTGIFWAEAFQNLGYAEGMLVPGMGVAGALSKAPRAVQRVLPSFISSIGEGSIEAIHAKNDEISTKQQLAHNEYIKKVSNASSPEEYELLNNKYQEALQTIENDALSSGNFTFGSNIALLTATNTIQFGKLFERGFGSAKRVANNEARNNIFRGTDGVYTQASKGIEIGKAAGKKLLDATSEGVEEVSQGIISDTPSRIIGFNEFNESEFNPEKRQLVADVWQGLGKSFSEAMQDPKTAEEFASGFVIGVFGIPRLKKSKFPITLENSIFEEINSAKKQWEDNQRVIDQINKRLEEDKELNTYYNGLVRHLALQDDINQAIDTDDQYLFESARSAQMISDIMMFDEVGGLDHLKELVNNSIDTSDEGIQAIIEETSKNGEGPFIQNGNPMSVEEVRELLDEKKQSINTIIDNYTKDKEDLSKVSPALPKDTMKALLFLNGQIRDHNQRKEELADLAFEQIKDLSRSIPTKSKEKITKGKGTYITINGKKRLVNKEDIDHYDANGNPIFKSEEGTEDPLGTRELFLKNLFDKDGTYLEWIDKLIKNNESTIPAYQRKEISRTLTDLIKLTDNVATHTANANDIFLNPTNASSIIEKNIEAKKQAIKDSKINIIKDTLKQATNISQLESLLTEIGNNEDLSEYLSDARTQIKEEENPENEELKNLLNNYDDKETLKSTIIDTLEDIEESESKQFLNNIVQDALNNSTTKDEFISTIEDAKQSDIIPEEVKSLLEDILQKVNRRQASKKAINKDSNKDVKKPKKPFSIAGLSDTGDELDPETKDRIEEAKKDSTDTSWIIERLEKSSVDELNKVVSGKTKYGKNEVERKEAVDLAKSILKTKNNPEELNNSEGTNSDSNTYRTNDEIPSLRSWVYTKYDISKLLDRNGRNATINDNTLVKALDNLGVFDFVDKGNLGLLFNENRDLPIQYILSKDSRLKDVIILAVEVTEEVNKLVDTPNSFIAQDGKRYQAVGALGYNNKGSKYYNKIKDILVEESKAFYEEDTNNESYYYVSTSISNKIKHIYSGRMVKSIGEEDPYYKPLSALIGKDAKLGIYYKGQLRVPALDEYEDIVPLNDNNSNPREGSVWLLNKEADGRYYAKGLRVKRFTDEEYPLEEYYDSPIVQDIVDNIRVLVDPNNSDYNRSKAKYNLMNILHFPLENTILFKEDIISIRGIENNIGEGLDIEEKIQAVLETLQSTELNLRFQVSVDSLGEPSYIEDLLESNIIETDLALLHNVNASFDLYLTDSKGRIIDENKEDNPKGHTGFKGVNNTIAQKTITINNKTYVVKEGITYLNNKKITNNKTLSEVQLASDIIDKAIEPLEGTNVYLGTYNDGTQFGIMNGTTIKGKKLQSFIKKESNKNKKQVLKNNTEQLLENASEEDIQKLKELGYTEGNSEETGFEDASTDEIAKLLNLLDQKEESEEDVELAKTEKKTKKKGKSKKTKIVPNINETFNSEEVVSIEDIQSKLDNPDLDTLLKKNRNLLRELGVRSNEYAKTLLYSKGIDLNTIRTEKDLINAIKNAKECK